MLSPVGTQILAGSITARLHIIFASNLASHICIIHYSVFLKGSRLDTPSNQTLTKWRTNFGTRHRMIAAPFALNFGGVCFATSAGRFPLSHSSLCLIRLSIQPEHFVLLPEYKRSLVGVGFSGTLPSFRRCQILLGRPTGASGPFPSGTEQRGWGYPLATQCGIIQILL